MITLVQLKLKVGPRAQASFGVCDMPRIVLTRTVLITVFKAEVTWAR